MRWQNWLALPVEVLHIAVAAAEAENPIAGHIRQGLAFDDETTTTVDANSTQSITTGSGPAFASSCQAALWDWKKSSESYGSQHLHATITTRPGSLYATYTYTDFTGGVKATRLTTLCDGIPRVIGLASFEDIQTSTVSFSPYPISTSVPGTFTTPMPCSIGLEDCKALWNSFASSTSVSLVYENKSALEPPCQTDPANSTVPFQTAACNYGLGYGPGVGVIGQEVRLLYWPVQTASPSDGYFCNGSHTPTYIEKSRTDSAPKTFVTSDITITSPTVALSFSGLHRLDGCGPTLDHTILTLPPSQLSSVRGARAAYGWHPFNLADLNWKCEAPNGTFTLQNNNLTSNGAECYQDVAAQAYFGAAPQVDWARGAPFVSYSGLTIVNNYRPYVIPDQKVGRSMLDSLWGTTATWWIDGTWDPPIALQEAQQEAEPTLPGGGYVSVTKTGGEGVVTTPAMTAHSTPTEVAPTALPDVQESSDGGGESQGGGEPAMSTQEAEPTLPNEEDPSRTSHGAPSEPPTPGQSSDDVPPNQNPDDHSGEMPANQNPGETSNDTPSNTPTENGGQDGSLTADSPPIIQSNEVYWKSQTLTIGGTAQTVDNHVASAGKAGLVMDVGSSSKTTLAYSTPSGMSGSMMVSPNINPSGGNPTSQDDGEDDSIHSDSASMAGGAGSQTSARIGGSSSSAASSTSPSGGYENSADKRRTVSWMGLVFVLALTAL